MLKFNQSFKYSNQYVFISSLAKIYLKKSVEPNNNLYSRILFFGEIC